MAKKSSVVKVRLESTAGTGYRYYAKRANKAEYKINKKKYDPWAENPETVKKGMHVMFEEKKLPPAKK